MAPRQSVSWTSRPLSRRRFAGGDEEAAAAEEEDKDSGEAHSGRRERWREQTRLCQAEGLQPGLEPSPGPVTSKGALEILFLQIGSCTCDKV